MIRQHKQPTFDQKITVINTVKDLAIAIVKIILLVTRTH